MSGDSGSWSDAERNGNEGSISSPSEWGPRRALGAQAMVRAESRSCQLIQLSGSSSFQRRDRVVTCQLSLPWEAAVERLFPIDSFRRHPFSELELLDEQLRVDARWLARTLTIVEVSMVGVGQNCLQLAQWLGAGKLSQACVIALVVFEDDLTLRHRLDIRRLLAAAGCAAVIDSFAQLDRLEQYARRFFRQVASFPKEKGSIERQVESNLPWPTF